MHPPTNSAGPSRAKSGNRGHELPLGPSGHLLPRIMVQLTGKPKRRAPKEGPSVIPNAGLAVEHLLDGTSFSHVWSGQPCRNRSGCTRAVRVVHRHSASAVAMLRMT